MAFLFEPINVMGINAVKPVTLILSTSLYSALFAKLESRLLSHILIPYNVLWLASKLPILGWIWVVNRR